MSQQIPLNVFRLVATPLISGSNSVYKETSDISTIILNATVTNVTEDPQTFSLQILKNGETIPVTLLKNFIIPPEESVAPIGGEGKIVLESEDELLFITNQTDAIEVILSILENAND